MNDIWSAQPRLLLLEPQNLLRRTVASVASSLQRVEIAEASSVEAAQRLLDQTAFDGLVMALDNEGLAAGLLQRLRSGAFRTESNVPVVVMTDACDARKVTELKAMNVRRILLKPFKVKGVLESITDRCVA